MKTKRFELSFFGGTDIRYKRGHDDIESAKTEARRVHSKMQNKGAHPAIIYEGDKQVLSIF